MRADVDDRRALLAQLARPCERFEGSTTEAAIGESRETLRIAMIAARSLVSMRCSPSWSSTRRPPRRAGPRPPRCESTRGPGYGAGRGLSQHGPPS